MAPMLIGQQVTVLGAGIAGLTAALALAQRGARVQVIEQAEALTEVGAGLQISPNGFAVLSALGLADQALALGDESQAVTLRDYRQGTPVLRLDLAAKAPDQTFLLFHRADLLAMLADAARAADVDILLGRTVNELAEDAAGVQVTCTGAAPRNVEICIGAEGLHSKMRALLNGAQDPFFTGQVAWRALVPGGQLPAEVQVFMGPGRHLVTYPLRAGHLTNIVAVEERARWQAESWSQTGDPEQLRAAFAAFAPQVRDLLARVDTVHEWGLFRHPVAARWYGAACALVGDAAHPTLPFLAQGANLALEDAWVLADCLATLPVAQALPLYQAHRQARVSRAISAANANARNYHLRHPIGRAFAHGALRLGSALAPQAPLRRFDWLYRHDVTKA